MIKLLIAIAILLIIFLLYNMLIKHKQISQNEQLISRNIPPPQIQTQQIKQNKPKHKSKPKHKKKSKSKKLVFFTIAINDKEMGKIKIKLFDKIVPKTCHNFRTLCQTQKYKNSPFHRIIKDFMIQGGDYTRGNGTGGLSIYGNTFPDENFELSHDRPYLLSMANAGPDTNGSQFFITTGDAPHLDGKHVVFGEITKGHEIIDKLNNIQTGSNDKPVHNVYIAECGAD